ncbi:LOW QUALITY PROTEIN: uncharacterized protein LOC110427624 [Herrania umbratica]|uniref:LOW QUALITY PROTEIN: uncharacterized protein LOC110427624 n=1 Tax=Herrania umbratica TaxID=108875 RepID=A0A6J1BHB2_9ROSI|nr:LOW QUALITY PROTEIN: uncharacterized protein LOC110427624 [Herrania umbratica]
MKSSYRNILMHDDQGPPLGGIESKEEGEILVDSYSDDDMSEIANEGPYIGLTKEEKRRIRQPWRNTLIVKLLGRDISYTYVSNRVKQLWSLVGEFEAVDLDDGFYCFRLNSKSNYDYVLSEGPRIIAGHYLTIRKWAPTFRLDEVSIESIVSWIQLPRMPLEFYDKFVLARIGNKLGKVLKNDRNTTQAKRGRFAQLCVEIDLDQPLVPRVHFGGRWPRAENEGLRLVFPLWKDNQDKEEFVPESLETQAPVQAVGHRGKQVSGNDNDSLKKILQASASITNKNRP